MRTLLTILLALPVLALAQHRPPSMGWTDGAVHVWNYQTGGIRDWAGGLQYQSLGSNEWQQSASGYPAAMRYFPATNTAHHGMITMSEYMGFAVWVNRNNTTNLVRVLGGLDDPNSNATGADYDFMFVALNIRADGATVAGHMYAGSAVARTVGGSPIGWRASESPVLSSNGWHLAAFNIRLGANSSTWQLFLDGAAVSGSSGGGAPANASPTIPLAIGDLVVTNRAAATRTFFGQGGALVGAVYFKRGFWTAAELQQLMTRRPQ
jgi:hypothetical protein